MKAKEILIRKANEKWLSRDKPKRQSNKQNAWKNGSSTMPIRKNVRGK